MTSHVSRRGILAAGAAAGVATGAGAVAGGASVARAAAVDTPAGSGAATGRSGPAGQDGRSGQGGHGVALTHVTVIDPHTARVRHDMTVLVRGDRIEAVHASGEGRVPAGVRAVDLRGRYVIPGLSDMHVHSVMDRIDPALHVANGVTTVREMAGGDQVFDWRRRIEAGELLGPRWTISSRLVDGAPSIWDPAVLDIVEVADAAGARRAVREEIRRGADFVKVYSRLPREALTAIADETRRLGVPFAGHCPDEVSLLEAARLGQRSFEHLFWTFFATSSKEAWARREIARIRLAQGDYSGWFERIHPVEWIAARTYDPDRAGTVFDRLASHGTRQVPTLIMHRGLDLARTLDRDDPRRRYLPAASRSGMDYALDELYLKQRSVAEDAEWAALFEYRLRLVSAMNRAGVPLMVGTDVATPGVFPGFAVHDELRLLVDAGLTPMAALHAATAEPARYLGTRSGRVAPGHTADLVVLGANPLDDIRNTRRIDGVVVRGRHLGPADLTELLRGVEEAAAEPRPTPAGAARPPCPCHAPTRAAAV